ncbi:MAG TPA: PLP-dependent aminotransferase family protein, partial [Polyangiaceae bacterium]|nr:PLP-dependent aminotransferase family protein [Polyangiaceae bacterium]
PAPSHERLARALVREIQRGRLDAGALLPGSRVLAESLGVNRKVVVAALDELCAEGWLEAVPARGTRVASVLPTMPVADVHASRTNWHSAPENKPDLQVSDGAPDARLAPLEKIARAHRSALTKLSRGGLGYGSAAGDPVLREVLAKFVNQARGLSCNMDEILITRGSQGALSLVALTLCRPGDFVAVETPGYVPAWRAFELAGADLVRIPVDEHGLVVDELEAQARALGGKLKALYVTPHHQYPTTVALCPERRTRLRALAAEHSFCLIEDDYDYEYHFDGTPLLPLSATHDPAVGTIYLGSFSKLIAPVFRVGYLVANAAFVKRASLVREIIDRQGDFVLERAIAELIEDGELQRHARRARRIYRERRDTFVSLLQSDARLKDIVQVECPAGGLAVWIRVNGDVSVSAWSRAAAQRGLRFAPGATHVEQGDPPAFRAGFASFSSAELERVVSLLSASLHDR